MIDEQQSLEDLDPSGPSTDPPFVAVAVNGTVDDGVVAIITDGLRVVRGTREWILEYREPKKWKAFAYCATKEGLLVRIRDHLLKARANSPPMS